MARLVGVLKSMTAKTKKLVLSASNVAVILGLILVSLFLVFEIVSAWLAGNYIASGIGVVTMYLLFMGTDVLCRRYLKQ